MFVLDDTLSLVVSCWLGTSFLPCQNPSLGVVFEKYLLCRRPEQLTFLQKQTRASLDPTKGPAARIGPCLALV